MPDIDPTLNGNSITPNFRDKNDKGFIVTFQIDPEKINEVPRKFLYKECLANDPSYHGQCYWVLRLKIIEKDLCLSPHKVDEESMIFLHEVPMTLIEYANNKLFVCCLQTHMYVALNWDVVKLITEPNTANTFKTYAFPVPDFDEESNPFIAVLGKASLNIVNVKNLQNKPLINQ